MLRALVKECDLSSSISNISPAQEVKPFAPHSQTLYFNVIVTCARTQIAIYRMKDNTTKNFIIRSLQWLLVVFWINSLIEKYLQIKLTGTLSLYFPIKFPYECISFILTALIMKFIPFIIYILHYCRHMLCVLKLLMYVYSL